MLGRVGRRLRADLDLRSEGGWVDDQTQIVLRLAGPGLHKWRRGVNGKRVKNKCSGLVKEKCSEIKKKNERE